MANSAPAYKWATSRSDKEPRESNVAGDFYVDKTCIDCDTCRWMAPDVFARVGGASAVVQQPTTEEGRVQALKALLSCPTHSIHAKTRQPGELRAAQQGLPAPVPGCRNVYYTGWHDEKSYAANAYLIVRPEGNILVDCPRYNPVLAKRIEDMGGISFIFLTHKDDVGDHSDWARHFRATRILHATEVGHGTEDVEMKLYGEGPWVITDQGNVARSSMEEIEEAPVPPEITLIFTPGHTSGHVALFYEPSKALFTGDHLCADDDDPEALYIFQNFNWYSVPTQLSSVAKLLQYDWLHVLPGHGRMAHLRDASHRLEAITNLLQKHGAISPVNVPA